MLKKTQTNKQKEKKEIINLEINRTVIESYIKPVDKNENKNIKINNKIYNLKNIDNNMSKGNLIDKNNNTINESERNFVLILSKQTNFNLISHIKKFDLSLLSNDSSINLFINKTKDDSKIKQINPGKTEIRNKYLINSTNLFIEGNHNIKSKAIKENQNIDLIQKTKLSEKDRIKFSLEIINKRWKETLKVITLEHTFINNCNKTINELEEYKEILISKMNFESNKLKESNNWFIILKQDIKSKDNKIMHKIINASTKTEFEIFLNQFINDDGSENNKNLNNNLNNNEIIYNRGRKKSKFNQQNNLFQTLNNGMNFQRDFLCPIIILNYLQLKNFTNEIEKHLVFKKNDKMKYYQDLKEEKISLDYKMVTNKENDKKLKQIIKSSKFSNIKWQKIDNIIFLNNSEFKANKNAIKINQKEFGQSTPISLLKEKYFIYAVSKWSKFSNINSDIKINLKKTKQNSKNPKFDSGILKMNNFYITVGKVSSEKDIMKLVNNKNNTSNNLKKNITSNRINKYNNEKNIIPKTKSFISNINKNNVEVSIRKKTKSKQKLKKK